MVIVMDLLKSISSLKAAITILAKHHGDSIVIFHSELVIFHISGGVGWGGVGGLGACGVR